MNPDLAKIPQLVQEDAPVSPVHPLKVRQPKIAYVMSRFPKLTETFVLYEMLAVEKQGLQVEVYPLLREQSSAAHAEGASLLKKIVQRVRSPRGHVVMHPDAVPLVERAHFQPFFSRHILRAQFQFLRQKPMVYLDTLWTVLRATCGSPRFLAGVLDIFPRTVYFAKQMEADGITHVHAHFANHPTAAAFIIHRLTGIPYSFTAHGSDLHVDRHMLREKVAEAAFVVTISNYNKELIVGECGGQFRDKIAVIHCGVDTRAFRPTHEVNPSLEEAESGILHQVPFLPSVPPFTILCIGLLQEVKGQTYLLEACQILHARGIEFACHFVGDGPDRAALMMQVDQAGLAAYVHFQGWRTHEETIELLRGAQVLALPSVPTRSGKREGIPVALMEAMASGVPVVASGISGIPELVEHERNGLLVPPRNSPALADALERLYGNPRLRQCLAKAGREKVVQEFDLYANAKVLAQRFTQRSHP